MSRLFFFLCGGCNQLVVCMYTSMDYKFAIFTILLYPLQFSLAVMEMHMYMLVHLLQ